MKLKRWGKVWCCFDGYFLYLVIISKRKNNRIQQNLELLHNFFLNLNPSAFHKYLVLTDSEDGKKNNHVTWSHVCVTGLCYCTCEKSENLLFVFPTYTSLSGSLRASQVCMYTGVCWLIQSESVAGWCLDQTSWTRTLGPVLLDQTSWR